MSTPTPPPRPLSSDSLIGRLVPFIDGELDDDERAAVEAELARDPELRAMVEEQVAVRGLLRQLPSDGAPQGLAARIRLDLDAVDREAALGGAKDDESLEAAIVPPLGDLDEARARRGWPRVAGFLRGALVMVPAAAAAALLFAFTRFAAPEAALEASSPPSVAAASPTAHPFAADGVPVIVGAPPGDAPGVSLAGLTELGADDPSMPEVVEYTIDARGTRVVDVRRPAAAAGPLPGVVLRYQDHDYHAVRDRLGRVLISFTADGTTHVLVPASTSAATDPQRLLELAHTLRLGASSR
ncbi:MAG: hypothetical protein R3B09_21485 [Nannocystaceae bacterium]